MSIGNPWIDPRVSGVRPADVRAYLLARGWQLKPFPRPELWVFEGPRADDGQPVLQVLPSSEQLADFRQRVLELITALATLEDRPAAEVLSDLLRASEATSPHSLNGPGAGRAEKSTTS